MQHLLVTSSNGVNGVQWMYMEPQEMQDRRRTNLRRWIARNCDSVAQAAQKADYSDSLMRGVLAGKKAFGEKLARKLEKSLQLETGTFDQPEKEPQRQDDWPFGFPRNDYERLDAADKQRITDTINGMIMGFSGNPGRKKKRTANGDL